MNNWHRRVFSHPDNLNRPRLIEANKRASNWLKRTHVDHFLLQACPQTQSQFSLHSDCVFVFVYGLVFSTKPVARTLQIDPTSLDLRDGRIFCFHAGICVKARAQPWIIFRGGGGKFVTMNTRAKIPRTSILTAPWTRSLTNAIYRKWCIDPFVWFACQTVDN